MKSDGKRFSLKSRFFWATLGLLLVAWLVSLGVATTFVTPKVLQQLVTVDERARLLELTLQLVQVQPEQREAKFQELRHPNWTHVEMLPLGTHPGALVEQPIPGGSQVLVSHRPVNWSEARKVVQPSMTRWVAALVVNFTFLYALVTLLSRFVTRPLNRLRVAVDSFAQGERGVSVEIPQEEELAQLSEAFNQMVQQLEARESELAQASAKLKQALAAKERVFANTSHELRTPLTAILGYVQMLEEGIKGPLSPGQQSCVEVIGRNSKALLSQVEDLLTMSRLQSGSFPLKLESTDLKELVQELVEDFRPAFENKELQLSTELPAEPVVVVLDVERGRRILSNLLDNARKFTPQGSVEVVLSSQGWLEVRDSGPGVDLDPAELFQEFSRGPNSEGVEGAGLGLALAQQLANSLGGRLRLLRSGPEGSVFRWEHQGEAGADSKQST